MKIHHIGYRISGFYHVGRRWEMNDQAQHRLNALRFWEDRGIAGAKPLPITIRRAIC